MEEAAHRNTDLSSVGLLPGQRKGLIKVTSFSFFFPLPAVSSVILAAEAAAVCRDGEEIVRKKRYRTGIFQLRCFFSASFFFLFFNRPGDVMCNYTQSAIF